VTGLLRHLRGRAANGRRLLVPYVVAAVPAPPDWLPSLEAVGRFADGIEVGLPFSDPVMDGPVIAEAERRAIAAGVGPLVALDLLAAPAGDPPRLAMTYYNPVHHVGHEEFCRRAAAAGIAGLVVPDLPVEESGGLRDAAAATGLAWVPLVAPTSTPARVEAIAATATGFVYAVSRLGVTGVRESLSERAAGVVDRCRLATDLPVLVGIGVSTPEQAVEAAVTADGVVIGSAVVRRLSRDGAGAAAAFLADVRAALDASYGGVTSS
jgi:tryptophan synthase alpha chain